MSSAKNEIIEIVEYDSKWTVANQQEKELITATLKQEIIDIQHIGSTSVLGLSAEPIIDILVAVNKLNTAETYSSQLQKINYSVYILRRKC